MMNWALLTHFSEWEFECKCGCGRANMNPYFLFMLQALRNLYDSPISISSGFRCPDHNDAISTTGRNGPHTTGCAIDIPIAGRQSHKLVRIALGDRTFAATLSGVISGARRNSIEFIDPQPKLIGGMSCMSIVSGYGSRQHGDFSKRFVHFDNLPNVPEDAPDGARRSPRPWHWTYS